MNQSAAPSSLTSSSTTRYGRLARRWARWTTNLLATGLILIGGLVVGRHIVRWWSPAPLPDPVSSLPTGVSPSNGNQTPINMGWPSSPFRLPRRQILGDRQAVLTAQRDDCRRVLEEIDATLVDWEAPPGPWEGRLLNRLTEKTPIESRAGEWEIHQMDGPFPMATGIRHHAAQKTSQRSFKAKMIAWSWAAAAPLAEERSASSTSSKRSWTLFTCAITKKSPAQAARDYPQPPGGQITFSLAEPGGGAIAAFHGDDRPHRWRDYFERWLASRGKPIVGAWRRSGSSWHARFGDTRTGWVDVQFSVTSGAATTPSGACSITGLMAVSPAHAGAQRE